MTFSVEDEGHARFPGRFRDKRGGATTEYTAEMVDGEVVIGRQTCDERFVFDPEDLIALGEFLKGELGGPLG